MDCPGCSEQAMEEVREGLCWCSVCGCLVNLFTNSQEQSCRFVGMPKLLGQRGVELLINRVKAAHQALAEFKENS